MLDHAEDMGKLAVVTQTYAHRVMRLLNEKVGPRAAIWEAALVTSEHSLGLRAGEGPAGGFSSEWRREGAKQATGHRPSVLCGAVAADQLARGAAGRDLGAAADRRQRRRRQRHVHATQHAG
jgi:hypothetical protein